MKQIKSQDLRIGILVLNRDNEVMRVDFIGRRNIRQADHFVFNGGSSVRWTSEDIDYIKPIPLTEEWLLRFGFEKSISLDGGSIMQLPGTNFYLEHIIFPGDTLKDCYYFNCESVKSGHRLCGHVHQLQTLYFALTGEELTLKSETTHETN